MEKQKVNLMYVLLQIIVVQIFLYLFIVIVQQIVLQKEQKRLFIVHGGKANILAKCIQAQIVNSLNMVDRGIKARPDLCVLRETTMPAVLVETAFISNQEDAYKLMYRIEEFANAISRGITDAEKLF